MTNSKQASKRHCFHCLEAMPKYGNLSAIIDQQVQPMCCLGCKAAAEFIGQRGLHKFYLHRERFDHRDFYAQVAKHQISLAEQSTPSSQWDYLDRPEANHQFIQENDDGTRQLTILVDGLYCRSCTWLIEKALQKVAVNLEVQADVDSRTLRVKLPGPKVLAADVVATIAQLGYSPSVVEMGDRSVLQHQAKQQRNKALTRIVVAGLGMMQVMTYATAGYFGGSLSFGDHISMSTELERFFLLFSMLVATVVVFYSGKPFFDNAINDLKNHHLGMDVPVALAIGGAYFPSVWAVLTKTNTHVYFDSAVMFVFFLSLGRFLEMQARHKLSSSGSSVHLLLPKTISVARVDNDEQATLEIVPSSVMLGDRIKLQSNNVIPFDAVIRIGNATLDESQLSGEVRAIHKSAGDHVYAGSKLLSGTVEIESTGNWAQSSIAKIEQSIRRAQNASHLEDQQSQLIARYFIGSVLLLTAIVASVWAMIAPQRVFEISLAMLIASCPCAFSLAAPVARSAATHTLKQFGILLTTNTALAKIADITQWCFDKTGTLTRGHPSVFSVKTLTGLATSECLAIAASLEQQSEHVLANAFDSIESRLAPSEVEEAIGQGVSGKINGQQVYLGKRSWVLDQISKTNSPEHRAKLNDLLPSTNEYTELILARVDSPIAVILLEDLPRESAYSFIKELINREQAVTVLSGDHQPAVASLSHKLGINDFHAALSPADKLRYIQSQQNEGHQVAMTGDGVNDAPVLAAADISIAMASGSTLALNNSDVVLLNGNLNNLEKLQTISKKTRQITHQNHLWALLYNACALPLAASGFLTPWLAALGMSLSSLLVVLNALRVNVQSSKKTVA